MSTNKFEPLNFNQESISKKQENEAIKELMFDPNDPEQFATIESKSLWEKLGFKNKKKEERIMSETSTKLKRVTNQLKRVLKENQEWLINYHTLEQK